MPRIFLLLTTLLCLTSCFSYTHLVKKGYDSTTARECGECHIDSYREWEDSAHANSFVNPAFREVTDEYRITACLSCHIPETVFTDGEVKKRDYLREEGVTCVSCHLVDNKLAGPVKGLLAPHPILEGDQRFTKSDICAKCHTQEFEDWEKLDIPDKKTCQECHMPSVFRKVIQDEPWQKIKRARDLKKHTFTADSPQVLKDSVVLGVTTTGMGLDFLKGTVMIENKKAGHSLPSGRFGYRKVELTVTALDADGGELALAATPFFVEMKEAIPAGGQKIVPFAFENLSGRPAALKARLVFHKRADGSRMIPLSEVTVNY
ncbi:MAG: multiheme c-type cytochrome [Nitrospirota bacterium]|nr:multiheme c-type cytochrome [Nitrospirota bacterium]